MMIFQEPLLGQLHSVKVFFDQKYQIELPGEATQAGGEVDGVSKPATLR
jgi:hypothetical protein